MATKAELEAELARYKAGIIVAMEKAQEAANEHGWCSTWRDVADTIAKETGIEEFTGPREPGYVNLTIENVVIGNDDDVEMLVTMLSHRLDAFVRSAQGRRFKVDNYDPSINIDDWGDWGER